MSQFRSASMAQKWADLHKERQKLIEGKQKTKTQEQVDLLSSLMSACKPGFLLTDAKIKKIIKFLKTETGKSRVKYGPIPENTKTQSILFKDIVVLYADKDDCIFFREHKE